MMTLPSPVVACVLAGAGLLTAAGLTLQYVGRAIDRAVTWA